MAASIGGGADQRGRRPVERAAPDVRAVQAASSGQDGGALLDDHPLAARSRILERGDVLSEDDVLVSSQEGRDGGCVVRALLPRDRPAVTSRARDPLIRYNADEAVRCPCCARSSAAAARIYCVAGRG